MIERRRVLVVCPHPEGFAPGQRLKYEQYFALFRENGFDLDVAPFQTRRFWNIVFKKGFLAEKIYWTLYGYAKRTLLLFKLRKYDIVYIFLWVTPFGPPFFEYLFTKLARRIVYDIDDLVFLGEASENSSFISKIKGRKKPIYLMKNAHHIVTCTPYLDRFARRFNPKTTDISSTIDTDKYRVANTYKNDHTIVLGWSGSYSTSKYLKLLHPMLIKLRERHDFILIVMGAATDFDMPGLDVQLIPWTEEAEISTIQEFDIGLYPLPNEQWVHGKSGLKAIQYMGMGIPTVASRIGEAIERVILDGKNGYLVDGYMEEWLEALGNLIESPELRETFGREGRRHVEEHYSVKANAQKYLRILNNL